MFDLIHLTETDSTNRWMRKHRTPKDRAVWADFQTGGMGSGTNRWESEQGKNLLLSLLWHPNDLPARDQFLISMAVSLAIHELVSHHVESCVRIKWPNDIYCDDRKICGILIENRLKGERVQDCIIGIGLNINQYVFVSDAPNPTSLALLAQRVFDREAILNELTESLGNYLTMVDDADSHTTLHNAYHQQLYRINGVHPFRFEDGEVRDCLVEGVDRYGRLMLSWKQTENGEEKHYHDNCEFKQVQFVIPTN